MKLRKALNKRGLSEMLRNGTLNMNSQSVESILYWLIEAADDKDWKTVKQILNSSNWDIESCLEFSESDGEITLKEVMKKCKGKL